MDNLDDALLVDAYFKAIELDLSQDFIMVLEEELESRGIMVVDGDKKIVLSVFL